MAKKQFKIGESAVGGIIAVEVTGKVIQIKALDYKTKEVQMSGTTTADDCFAKRKIDNFLNDLTSIYHANKIMEWIEEKVNLIDYDYS